MSHLKFILYIFKKIFTINIMYNNRPSWTTSFTTIIKIMKIGTNILPSNTNTLRLFTDLELPLWTPTLPSNIICNKMNIIELDGEWIYPDNIQNYKTHNKYILYIHGGAFCMCKAGTHRGLLFRLAKKTNTVIFSVNYRRAPEFKHPIPLNDCLFAYLYLLEMVKNPDHIIIAGDSAGGNLAINLLAELIKHQIPIPNKCILISPWTDLTDCGKNNSWHINQKYDIINTTLSKHFSLEYIDKTKYSLDDLSPIKLPDHILSKMPSLLVEYGECEVLHDQIELFCKKLKNLGVNIIYNCRYDMIHVFPLFHFTGIQQSKDFYHSVIEYIK